MSLGSFWASWHGPGCAGEVVGVIRESLKEDIRQCYPHSIARRTMVGVPQRRASRTNDISSNEKMSYVLHKFDMIIEVFTKDWKLDSPLVEYLQTSSFYELHIGELHHLRVVLCGGWTEEITMCRRDELFKSTTIWVTVAHRTWGNLSLNLEFSV